jgi:AcrR family transcriptional regulator
MSLRAKQSAARRARILDAAAGLVRETGSTEFTMLDVAAKAEVSPATPYNLFGSKNGLLYASLNRSLDALIASPSVFPGAPIEHPIAAGERATGVIAADPVYFRPLFLVMLGVPDDVHRAQFLDRSHDYWRRSVRGLEQAGMLGGPIDLEDLSRALLLHYMAVLGSWAHGDLEADEFLAQVVYGIALHLLAVTDEASRPRLLERMRAAKRTLPRGFRFTRSRRGEPEPEAEVPRTSKRRSARVA